MIIIFVINTMEIHAYMNIPYDGIEERTIKLDVNKLKDFIKKEYKLGYDKNMLHGLFFEMYYGEEWIYEITDEFKNLFDEIIKDINL